MNALTNEEGAWTSGDDGNAANGGEIEQEGPTLTVTSAKQGSPFNVRYNGAITPDAGDWCFEVILVHISRNSNVSIGIVHPEEMLPGYKTRGMFYNGNLTNGSAALRTSFGPYLQEGDAVSIMVTNNNRDVTFFHDGRCLGVGFRLEESNTYCPSIQVTGKVQICFNIPDMLLPVQDRQDHPPAGIVGDWKLVTAVNEQRVAVEIPSGHDLILTITTARNKEDEYEVSMRVGNILRTHLTLSEGNVVKVGQVMSTMMMPPPELQEMERFLSTSLPKITSMNHHAGQSLTLSNDDLHLVFSRYRKMFEPLTKYK